MVQKIILTLGCALLAAILYRLGGCIQTKIRDLGVPTVFCFLMWKLGAITGFWTGIALLPCFLALFGSLTSYFKKKGTDAYWWNWALVGLLTAFSAIFYAWASGHWLGFGIRLVVNTLLITLWSEWIGNVTIEEGGRGFFIIVTVPLLLL